MGQWEEEMKKVGGFATPFIKIHTLRIHEECTCTIKVHTSPKYILSPHRRLFQGGRVGGRGGGLWVRGLVTEYERKKIKVDETE